MERLRQTVLQYIRKHRLISAGDRVGVAVSGGADSVALLRLLLDLRSEIGIVVSVIHFNHNLRAAESNKDEAFVAELARTYGLEFYFESGDVKAYAAEKRLSLETAAREVRYRFFRKILFEKDLKAVATAHTLDDQAETVLLRLVRGAGGKGLAGIYPKLLVESGIEPNAKPAGDARSIVRPLLGTRRRDLEQYLAAIGQSWREDGSNRDLRHFRNLVRHGILPRLERNLNPAVREALAETAEVARQEEIYWNHEIAKLLPKFWRTPTPGECSATLGELDCHLPDDLAVQRRIVRAAAGSLGLNLEFKHVEEVLALAGDGASGSTTLPDGWTVRRERDWLKFAAPIQEPEEGGATYQRALRTPGRTDVPEAGISIEISVLDSDWAATHDPNSLLRLTDPPTLLVRSWRPGDRFWPSHTKSPKKIKELLVQKHIMGAARKAWPVVVSGSEIVWVRGFRTAKQFQPKLNERALLIRELPLRER